MKFITLLLAALLYNSIFSQPADEGYNSISVNEIKENLQFLASDSLKGRSAGSDENLIAAMFIAQKFKDYGLQPLIKNKFSPRFIEPEEDERGLPSPLDVTNSKSFNDYFQRFTFEKTKLAENNSLSLRTDLQKGYFEKKYQYNIDFIIQSKSSVGQKVKAPVVFAGYGITKGEAGYNDYLTSEGKEIDVKNKIVVIVDGYPLEQDTTSSFSKSRNAQYRNPLRKTDAALEKGALGVIIISSPYKNDPSLLIKYDNLKNAFTLSSDHLQELTRAVIPVIYVSRNVSADIFQGNKQLKEILDEIELNLKPQAFEFEGKEISFEINVENQLVYTQNVIGFIEGSDPVLKDEVVVFGAHYDHVGLGYYGAMNKKDAGRIHNGADDNASGTCSLIELAEAFSKNKPKRSVLFAAFSAEENGLLGSRYYVYMQPLKPLDKTVAMVNMDMVGRNEDKVLWIGGAFYSMDLIKLAEGENKETGFELLYNVGLLNSASDQAPFLRKEIPALFFFAGLHDDYHTPADDADKINFNKIEKVTRLAYLTGKRITNRLERPVYKELNLDERAALVRESVERQKLVQNKTK